MKRIDKIEKYLKEMKWTIDELRDRQGLSTDEIARNLHLVRTNVSKELNELVRRNKVIKIKKRPVLYIHRDMIEKILKDKISEEIIEVDDIKQLIKEEKEQKIEMSPFDCLIGSETSLKNQIEQAKAAILYPPNGLHSLIIGQTGVGKTLFANIMFEYGKKIKRFDDNAPFVAFNCADYYNNSQLLISQIFGHVKGAFTGADTDKDGLVEKANGGILFLDEIHRLPPEGQEMIFYFMDTGTYNKLGETERKRKANVLIIGATNEDINSHLLKTFMRRIPIIINIPSFEDRPCSDKVEMVRYLLSKEARRVNKKISITEDVVKALIGSVTYGNIGQLKSNIQLICARGFLNFMNKESIDIDFKMLPSSIKEGLLNFRNKRKDIEEISDLVNGKLIVTPNDDRILISLNQDLSEPPFNLYKIIEDKISILKSEGMDEQSIKEFIATDIKIHLKGFYKKFEDTKNKKEKLLSVVDENILDFASEIKKFAENKLKRKYSDRFIYALGLHLSALFKRIKNNMVIQSFDVKDFLKYKQEEIETAFEIKSLIEKKYNIIVPDAEVGYITILLVNIEEEKDAHVGIIVAAHGDSTASSMVNVATSLLGDLMGEKKVEAVDMPLNISPNEILKTIIEKVKKINSGKGVLLLVDMGSLCNFDTVITEQTGIKVKILDMVSTPTLIEAIRKSYAYDLDLDSIYESLKDFRGYATEVKNNNSNKEKAIITICSSGQGTAIKLKELVNDIVTNITDEKINIIPVGIKNMKNDLSEIKDKYNIIASIGMKDPNLPVPFISLERLIEDDGEELLRKIVSNHSIKIVKKDQDIAVRNLCRDSLNQFLTFLNPDKIINLLIRFCNRLEIELNKQFSNTMKIKLIIHTGCALERTIINDSIKYKDSVLNLNKDIIEKVRNCSKIFSDALNINLIDDEIYLIAEMLCEQQY
ncbi:sigma 54-interacting transcriptional regulator [Thermoanaerobacterium thermosaccharolyticum]|uniref:sigma 54-interacting transcriptional regulator n=1 Tax=Thermoanaerobacterium thermosaccharolyticum TaxID=1517 RepID=UPI0020A358A4|nr:sigma-54-dependent transcriptional regulator [Thermoanaerobacterium thermosaccharolyticum]MCP2240842.1 transcriptional regulatory protein LevR/transcriptional regulator with AAA-type ATPase domain [Thermoanaerobacterium thermosaccharolyticum]